MIHTIMIPTRGRPALLEKAVNCIVQNATEPDRFEVLVCADEDDTATAEVLSSPVLNAPQVKTLTIPNTFLREKYNAMEAQARGRLWYYWSDDVFMLTKGWDISVRLFYESHQHRKFIASFKDDIWNGNMRLNVPAGPFFLTREWVSAIGHSINPKLKWQAIDLWLWDVARRADLLADSDEDKGLSAGHYREYLSQVHAHHAHHERQKDQTDEAARPDFEPAVKGTYDNRAGEEERQAEARLLTGRK